MAEKEVKKVATKAVDTPWLGSAVKVFKGASKSVDLRELTSEQLEGYRKKYPSCFKKVKK